MRRVVLMAALLLLAAAGTAQAQDAGTTQAQDARRGDLFAGYSALLGDETAHGFETSLGWQLWGPLGLLADASRHSGNDVVAETLLVGPRFVFGSGKLRPSVHALAGVTRGGASISVFGVTISEKATDLAGAVGGALDVGGDRRWSLRVKADYLLVRGDSETTGDPRLSAGVVLRF